MKRGGGGRAAAPPRQPLCISKHYGCSAELLTDISCIRKMVKIIATRCYILRLKCTESDFGWGSAPDLARGAHSAPPDPPAGFKESYF